MSYLTEFPDYDGEFYCPKGWADNSWHNDFCPHIEKQEGDIVIYVWQDYVDVNLREFIKKRYLFVIEKVDEMSNVTEIFNYETDDLEIIKEFMSGVFLN